jgi:hypothetical protein
MLAFSRGAGTDQDSKPAGPGEHNKSSKISEEKKGWEAFRYAMTNSINVSKKGENALK